MTSVNELKKDVNTNHVLDNGNNENLSEGESLEKGEFIEADSPYVTSDYQERLENRKERLENYSKKAAKQSLEAYSRGHDMAKIIPFGQPILVGHHSEKRDRNYRAKFVKQFDKSLELGKKAEYFENKAASVGTGGVASNDPEAVKKLKEKLQKLEASRDKMKVTNKALRSNDDDALLKIGYSVEAIAKLKEPDCFNNIGFASYTLTNISAEIRRLKKRIESLSEIRQSEPLEFENDDLEIFVSDGYIVIDFKFGKPSDEVRKLIKSNAFKWSRVRIGWVRKVTANALYSTKRLIESLKVMKAIY